MDDPEPASSGSEHARSGPEPSMEDPEHARSGSGASLRRQEPASGGSEPAGGGSGSQQEVAPKAAPEATPAAAASLQHQDADEVIDVTDRRGWAVRHDTTGMVPYELTLFRDPVTRRYYNTQGQWVDSLGRRMPHRGQPGQYRARGRHFPNTNPGGPGANPRRVWERFGTRSELSERPSGGSASRSGSQNPPWHTESGQPAAARGPPAAAKGKGKGSHRAKGSLAAKGPPAAASRNMSQRAAAPRSSRASSTGPPPRTGGTWENRADWKHRDHWKHRDGWNAGNDWQSEWWQWGR